MFRLVVLSTAALLSLTTAASALNFTPTADNRRTDVSSNLFGVFNDSDSNSPAVAFSPFSSNIDANSDYDGYFADAFSFQDSQVGAMYIQGNGNISAQIGFSFDNQLLGDAGDIHTDNFGAGGQSILEIIFSVDMDAHYDLTGFIGAGAGISEGGIEYGSNQVASVELFDVDNSVVLVKETVTDSEQDVATSGHIGPGTYRFLASASAEVFGSVPESDDVGLPGGSFYSTSAGFKGINLTLSGRDQPIPEPVTSGLIGLGLFALAFQATRRRRA